MVINRDLITDGDKYITIINTNWIFRTQSSLRTLPQALISIAGSIALLDIIGCTPVIKSQEESDAVLNDASILADCGKKFSATILFEFVTRRCVWN